MSCQDYDVLGGAGCVLPVDHEGDHSTVEGATWPRLIERDCPRCGALMYSNPASETTGTDLPCPACQEDDDAALTPR